MTESPLPDQLFVLDRAHGAGEFLDMLLTLCTFGINVSLLLVERGVEGMALEHRGIPVVRFREMGLQALMVERGALKEADTELPDGITLVDQKQIQTLYRQVPRVLHP